MYWVGASVIPAYMEILTFQKYLTHKRMTKKSMGYSQGTKDL